MKAYYEAEESGLLRNPKNAADWRRFRRTARHLLKGWSSLLDVGCGEGYWLDFLHRRYGKERMLRGYEYAGNRVEAAQKHFPHLDLREGSIFELPEEDGSYDVVTCLEVLEHLPDWQAGFEELLRIAKKEVIVCVPRNEKIKATMCIHCHKMTPYSGHLHSFKESTFDPWRARYEIRFDYISGKWGFYSKYLDLLRRRIRWMLVRVKKR
ncbi:MAG: class I SAM-dependent methyltransferase [Planctomycetia bacterium]